MFQSRAVDSSRNVITINGIEIAGGIPVSPATDSWNGNVMLIDANVLKASYNRLHIRCRTVDGELDNFILDNMVVMYQTR
jgi:hypothetical protein